MKQKDRSKHDPANILHGHSTKRISLLVQILVFFIAFMAVSAVLSSVLLNRMVYTNVMREQKDLAKGVSSELQTCIKAYKAYDWVIGYLMEHKDEPLDLEYDTSVKSDKKADALLSKHHGIELMKVTPEELDAFSPEDQKAFVEIVYNRWVSRFNAFIGAYDLEYIYFFATDDQYRESMFIVNGAKEGLQRGTNFGEAYVFGVAVTNNKQQHDAFSSLLSGFDGFVYSEGFMDYYCYLFKIGGWNIISGMTVEYANVQADINAQTYRYAFFLVLFHIVQAVIGMLLIYVLALRPLRNMKHAVETYGKNKNSEEVVRVLSAKQYSNEFGTLSQGVQNMIREIDEHIEQIKTVTAEKEHISAELSIAAQIQANMLPRRFPAFPDRSEFDLYASMTPAKEVGGDFYDFFLVDDDHLALVIADVSGKGVPAALFMAISKTLLENRAQMGGTPGEIIASVNSQLCARNESELFVTVWFAVIELSTGKGIAVNAGHEHPALCRKDEMFSLVKYTHSPALGVFDGIQYTEHPFELHPGDSLFVYTDGVAEANDQGNNRFGTDRMLAALNRDPAAPPDALLRCVRTGIDTFAGDAEQFDDITMMCFKYFGRN